MSGQTAYDKLVRAAAVCRGGEAEISQFEEVEATELNGVEEEEEEEEKECHSETGTHCMMGRGRTHHHVTKQKIRINPNSQLRWTITSWI